LPTSIATIRTWAHRLDAAGRAAEIDGPGRRELVRERVGERELEAVGKRVVLIGARNEPAERARRGRARHDGLRADDVASREEPSYMPVGL
jgi:hypothetical protein